MILAAMGNANLVADPEWVHKLAWGKININCIRCNICMTRILRARFYRCEVISEMRVWNILKGV